MLLTTYTFRNDERRVHDKYRKILFFFLALKYTNTKMSSDEEDLDLNDDTTSQMETITDDGGDIMEIEGKIIRKRCD
jgi:hypothetical protein